MFRGPRFHFAAAEVRARALATTRRADYRGFIGRATHPSRVWDLAIVPMLLLPLAGASGSVEIKVYRERNAGEMGNSGVMEL